MLPRDSGHDGPGGPGEADPRRLDAHDPAERRTGAPLRHGDRPQRECGTDDDAREQEVAGQLGVGRGADGERGREGEQDGDTGEERRGVAGAAESREQEPSRQADDPSDDRPAGDRREREAGNFEAGDLVQDHRLEGAVDQHAPGGEQHEPTTAHHVVPAHGRDDGAKGRRGPSRDGHQRHGNQHGDERRGEPRRRVAPAHLFHEPRRRCDRDRAAEAGEQREHADRRGPLHVRAPLVDADVGGLVERHRRRGAEDRPPDDKDVPRLLGGGEGRQAHTAENRPRHDDPADAPAIGDPADRRGADGAREDRTAEACGEHRGRELRPCGALRDEHREAVEQGSVGDADGQRQPSHHRPVAGTRELGAHRRAVTGGAHVRMLPRTIGTGRSPRPGGWRLPDEVSPDELAVGVAWELVDEEDLARCLVPGEVITDVVDERVLVDRRPRTAARRRP